MAYRTPNLESKYLDLPVFVDFGHPSVSDSTGGKMWVQNRGAKLIRIKAGRETFYLEPTEFVEFLSSDREPPEIVELNNGI